jgi:hypothetical protein
VDFTDRVTLPAATAAVHLQQFLARLISKRRDNALLFACQEAGANHSDRVIISMMLGWAGISRKHFILALVCVDWRRHGLERLDLLKDCSEAEV